jgi:hypothetical protein
VVAEAENLPSNVNTARRGPSRTLSIRFRPILQSISATRITQILDQIESLVLHLRIA